MAAELRNQMHMQEVEKKLKLLQMNWFIKNHEESNENPDRSKPAQSVQMTKLVEEVREMRAQIKEINIKVDEYQKELNLDTKRPNDTNINRLDVNVSYMYPVPPDIESQLYNGISRNEEGRYRYLRTRTEFAPDEKYRLCPTQNYIYGWNFKQQMNIPGLKHGRKKVLKTAMYSIHGITLYGKHPTQRPPNSPGHLEIDVW